ncbi:MAG TPA: ATP-binding cassette domain-containing protein [Thiotrichaceae bacterium]|nr:ATP-binding cassette domain-containing protein [Thiotrichaceae bacterium]
MKIKQIKINSYKVLQNLEISFTDREGNILDTVVIAGVNGTGKTTLLELIQNSLTTHFRFDNNDDAIDFVDKDATKLIYISVFDHPKELVSSKIKDFLDMREQNEDLTIKESNIRLTDEINSIFEGLDLNTKFKGISKSINREVIFENDIRDDIKLDELSTGEQQLFVKALNLKMMALKNSLILIDEPELSLHPNWQNHILRIYQNIASQGDNQLIVATHSPQIISSTPNQSLRILIKKGKNIEVKQVDKTYGIEIDEVLQDLMGTQYLRTPPIAKEINRMWNYLNSGDLNNFELIYDNLENFLDINDKELLLARFKQARLISRMERS